MADAPTPWRMRNTTSEGSSHARAHSADATTITSTPSTNMRRLP